MKSRSRSRSVGASLAPHLLWFELATRSAEMFLASGQVIAQRTQRMALAGPTPNARDRREFARMGSEKVDAARASATAMSQQLMTMPWNLVLPWWQGVVTARTPAQALEAGTRGMTQASKAGARLASRGLAPVHARATANARRLSKG